RRSRTVVVRALAPLPSHFIACQVGRSRRCRVDGVEPEPVKAKAVDPGDRSAVTVGNTYVDLEIAPALGLSTGDDVYSRRLSRFTKDPATLEPDRQVDTVGRISINECQVGVETRIEKRGVDHVAAMVDVRRKRDRRHDLAPVPAHRAEASEGGTIVESVSGEARVEAFDADPTPAVWRLPPLLARFGRDAARDTT